MPELEGNDYMSNVDDRGRALVAEMPTNRKELAESRLNGGEMHINDMMDMHFMDFLSDETVAAYLRPVYNDQTRSGKVEFDQLFAATRILELAKARDIHELAGLKPAQCLRVLRVVLRRFGLMPWQRIEKANREAEAAAE